MISVSLPFDWLINGSGPLGSRTELLNILKKQGVKNIELRTVRPHHQPEDVQYVANMLWDEGFEITIHGAIKSDLTAVQDVFAPLTLIFHNLRQPRLNVTIHPINGNNAAMLTELSDYCIMHNYPIIIALENNRLLPDVSEGDSTALVLDAVKKADRENVGICFDLGHYIYYITKNRPDEPDLIPDPEFLKRTVHTHIHALNGLKTHFPLDTYKLPLKKLLDAMAFEYFGAYNIELDFPRFEAICDPVTALEGSIKELKKSMPVCAQVYDEIRENFDNWMTSAVSILKDNEPGTKFALIHASSYLFNTNGYKWGVDIAFRNALHLSSTPENADKLLSDLDLMIISHNHVDHFEKSTVEKLGKTDIEWVIPDFLVDTAIDYGVSPEKMHIAYADRVMKIGTLEIMPFKGHHFRPVTKDGLEEYGYYIKTENGPSIAFPMDVRDYSIVDMSDIPEADYCFAHVWLGDGNCLDTDFAPLDQQFAEFMLNFSKKNIFLTHLWENGRKAEYMWQDRHAEILKDKILSKSPDTTVHIPKCGEIINL